MAKGSIQLCILPHTAQFADDSLHSGLMGICIALIRADTDQSSLEATGCSLYVPTTCAKDVDVF